MPSKVMRGQKDAPCPQGWLPLPSHPRLTRRLEHPAAAVAQAPDTPWTGDLGPQHPGAAAPPLDSAPPRPPRPHTPRPGGVQRGCAGARGRTAAGAPPLTCAGRGGRSAGGQGGGRGAAVSPVPTGLKRAARARPRGGPRAAWGRGLLELGGTGTTLGVGLLEMGGAGMALGVGPCRIGRGQSRLGPGLGKWAGPKGRGRGGPGRAGGAASQTGRDLGGAWVVLGAGTCDVGRPKGRGRSEAGWGLAESGLFGAEHGRGFPGRNKARSQEGAGQSLTRRTRVGGAGPRWSLGRSLQWYRPEEGRAQIQGWGFAS